MKIQSGFVLGKSLADVLGIIGKPWDRIVIVADVNDVARVYVRGYVDADPVRIAQVVKDVQVSDDGDVSVIPFAEEVTGE